MIRIKWNYQDDYICCKRYWEFALGKHPDKSIEAVLLSLKKELPKFSLGSLRMKLQNIKQISIDLKLNDNVNISPLDQYSRQCKDAFKQVLKEFEKPLPPTLNQNHEDPRFKDAIIIHDKYGIGYVIKVENTRITARFTEKTALLEAKIAFKKFFTFKEPFLNYLMESIIAPDTYDPIEDTYEYKKILPEVERAILKEFKDCDLYEACEIYWTYKKRILKERYNIDWQSPIDLKKRKPHDFIIY